ncbi:tetratricopeptide repeat protein [Mastigocladopsis repens]|uniref:tetratricopeptide repeat protein n=1 Tax=Mastigocladopsis repens TaxID=221287 RepID=UPI00036DC84E
MNLELTDWDKDLPPEPEEEYKALVRTLNFIEGFSILFVRCSPARGEQLIAQVKEDIADRNIETLSLKEPVDNLYKIIEENYQRNKNNILFITGLEHSFYKYEECKRLTNWNSKDIYSYSWKGVPPVLINLNQQRERFRDNFNICFVFLLPLFAIKYLIHRAPDFFDWRSGLFEFPIDPKTLEQESSHIFSQGNYEKYLSLTPQERTQKILEIQELIAEDHQTPSRKGNLLVELGNLYVSGQNNEEAVASYDQALKIKPDYDSAWNNRGNALGNLGRYEEAVASYDQALKIKPDDDSAWYNRGIALGNLGRYEEAVASYDQALKFKPDDDSAWNNRGNALDELGRYEEAVASFDQALKFKPDDHSAWYNRGYALGNLGRYEEEIASYDQALKFKPDDHSAWYNKARCYALQGNIEQAIENLEKAIHLNPDKCQDWAKNESDFDSIREDERFVALIQGQHTGD